MMPLAIDILSGLCIVIGIVFMLAGVIGLVRLPDIYTRLHGASITDTAGAAFLMLGMILQAGFSLVTLKLLFLLAIFLFTLPAASHALARAAQHEGIAPTLASDRRARSTSDKTGAP